MDRLLKYLNLDKFGFWFIVFGLSTQVLTYIVTEDTMLSLISGMTGVISVVLCSQRKISFYFWGFIQLFTFCVICYQEQLYGKIIENLFYLITMIIGLVIWIRNKDTDELVETRSLTLKNSVYLTSGTVVAIVALFYILTSLNDSQPLIDSISTVLAIVAQMLMILRYKESWIYWLLVDLLCIVMFIIAENWCMTMQYIFWTFNCIYGFLKWKS